MKDEKDKAGCAHDVTVQDFAEDGKILHFRGNRVYRKSADKWGIGYPDKKEEWINSELSAKFEQLYQKQCRNGGFPKHVGITTGPKKNKHGILQIVSSAGPSHKKYSFGYGCWVSKKYPGKFSVLLGIAGKRYVYTISKVALEAKILMEQKALRRAAEKDPT